MKKVYYIKSLCLVVILLLICGCGKNSKLEEIIEENNYGYGWGQSNSEGIVCEEIKDAVSATEYFFVTSDGSLYKFNGQKLFSNNKNCMKVDYGNNNISYILVNGLYDKNNNLIYSIYNDGNSTEVLSVSDYKDIKGYNPNDYLNLSDINDDFDFVSYGGDTNIYIKDHIVFWYVRNGNSETKEKKTYEIPSDENILGLFGAVIKTDKNYYVLTVTNEEECEKYADTKCNVGFIKSSFNEIYDDIIFLSDKLLIDKDWHVYGHGSSYSLNNY